ncbi:hypothetical protein K456DRAFT_33219 [Colletotrichum gloeosporioides 23]|nr:hypothetical protein K456DRAFT_33219 [Colletotrichum gloeosporioides 23]
MGLWWGPLLAALCCLVRPAVGLRVATQTLIPSISTTSSSASSSASLQRTGISPNPVSPYSYLGCYTDEGLAGSTYIYQDGIIGDPVRCQARCADLNALFVYLVGTACYCAPLRNMIAPRGPATNDENCNRYPCRSDSTSPCGCNFSLSCQAQYVVVYGVRSPAVMSSSTSTSPLFGSSVTISLSSSASSPLPSSSTMGSSASLSQMFSGTSAGSQNPILSGTTLVLSSSDSTSRATTFQLTNSSSTSTTTPMTGNTSVAQSASTSDGSFQSTASSSAVSPPALTIPSSSSLVTPTSSAISPVGSSSDSGPGTMLGSTTSSTTDSATTSSPGGSPSTPRVTTASTIFDISIGGTSVSPTTGPDSSASPLPSSSSSLGTIDNSQALIGVTVVLTISPLQAPGATQTGS